jgi:hypothetical protein
MRQKLALFDHRSIKLTFSTAQLVRNSRYQQLAEGIERTDRRELERHQMGFAEWQLLQHGVRCLSVGHIQDENDTRPPNGSSRAANLR